MHGRRTRTAEERQGGDEPFDGAVLVQGKANEILAVLDAPTRQAVDEGLAANLRVSEGCLRRRVNCENLAKEVRRTVELATWLSLASESIPARLAQNACEDPVGEVRLRNVEALLRDYPDEPLTRKTLRALLDDVSPKVRLRAALALKSEGHATLARLTSGREANEEIAIEAFEALSARLPENSHWSAIDSALRHPSRWLRARALAQVLRVGGRKALTRLGRADPPPVRLVPHGLRRVCGVLSRTVLLRQQPGHRRERPTASGTALDFLGRE